MHRSLTAAVLLATTAAAQHSIALLTSPSRINTMTFDLVRDRAVEVSYAGEVFEYHHGVRLQRMNLAGIGPGARQTPGLAYDPLRRHVLLFGGYDGTVLADTWSWDGARWTQLASGPPGREDPAITFDTVRGRVLMFGGSARALGGLNDTWEHDGTQWRQRFPATVIQFPSSPRMAFDSLRGVAVMIFPSGFGAPVQTWEWNGANWTLRNAGTSGPTGLQGESVVYDPNRQRTVVAGGGSQTVGSTTVTPGREIWEWDGNAWTLAATLAITLRRYGSAWFDPSLGKTVIASGPETASSNIDLEFATWDGSTLQRTTVDSLPIHRFSSAWCSTPGGALMFGGSTGLSTLGDTWLWNGHRWVQFHPTGGPSPRIEPAAAFDPARGATLLFGGGGGSQILGDCWSWNGTTWAALPTGPSARYGAVMAFDLARNEMVLFGGANGLLSPAAVFGDTWTFNGSTWRRRFPAHSPSARHAPAMAYDLGNLTMLLFGGRTGATAADQFDDTWRWNGADWQLLGPVSHPPALVMPTAAFDWGRAHIQVEGFHTGSNTEELWEWTGLAWRLRQALPVGLLTSAPMTQCLATGALVRFDGTTLRVWSNQPAETSETGPGCGTPQLFVRARPSPGEPASGLELRGTPLQPCAFALDFAPGNTPLGGGCTLWLQGLTNVWFATTDARGDAELPFAVPDDPLLRSGPLFVQAAVLDPSQPSGFATTPGLRLRLGD